MKSWILLVAATMALAARQTAAQDFELEFTEAGLNRLIARLGDPGSGGIHQPNALSGLGYSGCIALGSLDCSGSTAASGTAASGAAAQARRHALLSRCQGPDGRSAIVPGAEPVPWQWWITQARFRIEPQQLLFAASVRYRVGTQWFKEERTVPAALRLDVGSQRLRIEVSNFTVPIRHGSSGVVEGITEVDVARHMSFSIPISAQTVQVPVLDGASKSLTSRVQSANVEYLAGKVRVKADVAIN